MRSTAVETPSPDDPNMPRGSRNSSLSGTISTPSSYDFCSEKEVVPGTAPEVVPGVGLELARHDGLEVLVPPPSPPPRTILFPTRLGTPRRRIVVIASAVAVLLAIIAGITAGVVVATRKKNDDSNDDDIPLDMAGSKSISTISWVDGRNETQIRLYYISAENELMEAVGGPNGTWEHTPLGFTAIGGSDVAAAVNRPNERPDLWGYPDMYDVLGVERVMVDGPLNDDPLVSCRQKIETRVWIEE